jgi:hypothetical protein
MTPRCQPPVETRPPAIRMDERGGLPAGTKETLTVDTGTAFLATGWNRRQLR